MQDLPILMTWLSALAASFLAWRAFIRLHVMCPCSPHLIRISAYMMAASACAIILGALGQDADLVEWGRTFALISVALHILCDRRGARIHGHIGERRAA